MNAHINPEYWLTEHYVQSAQNAAPSLDQEVNNSQEAVTVIASITIQEVAAISEGVTTNYVEKYVLNWLT